MRHRLLLEIVPLLIFVGASSATADVTGAIRVSGLVVDSDGEPAVGVPVELMPIVSSCAEGAVEAPREAAGGVTGRDGRFVVTAPGVGMWEVMVRGADGWAARWELAPLLHATHLAPLRLGEELADVGRRRWVEGDAWGPVEATPAAAGEPGAGEPAEPLVFRGRIVDAESGLSVPGAFVWTVRDPSCFAVAGRHGDLTLRVAGFAFDILAIRAATPRHATAHASLVVDEETEVPLEPAAGRLELAVVDAEGQPVPEAFVETGRLYTDADGVAVLHRLPPEAALGGRVLKDGYRASLWIFQPGESPTRQTVRLWRLWELEGRVVDAHGTPVGGVTVRSGSEPHVVTARTGEHGRFGLTAPAHGGTEITLSHPEWAETRYPTPLPNDGEGRRDLGDLELRPPIRLLGRVLDPAGYGLAGAEIRIRQRLPLGGSRGSHGAPSTAPYDATSDEEGLFVLDRLARSQQLELEVRRDGFLPARHWVAVDAEGDAEDVSVRLERGYSIAGRVLGPTGEPVADVQVDARELRDEPRPWPSVASSSTRTDAEGCFALGPLPRGTLRLVAVPVLDSRLGATSLELTLDETTEDVELRLGASALVYGTIVGLGGEPIASVDVRPVDFDPRVEFRAQGQSDATGRSELILPAGDVELLLVHPELGSAIEPVRALPGEQRLDVVFAPRPIGAEADASETRPDLDPGAGAGG